MGWVFLIAAGVLEMAWGVGLKESQEWTKLYPSIFTVVTIIASVFLLSLALKTLPLGTAYAVWVGIGTLGLAIYGIIFYGESTSIGRLLSMSLIVIGVIGLKLIEHS